MERLQQKWNDASTERWTHRLIPNIQEWLLRKHGEVDHYLTQLLSEHGCFLAYQKLFKISESVLCPVCKSTVEDAEHVCFVCLQFHGKRVELQKLLHRRLTPENLVHQMTSCEDNWNAVANYTATIIEKRRRFDSHTDETSSE